MTGYPDLLKSVDYVPLLISVPFFLIGIIIMSIGLFVYRRRRQTGEYFAASKHVFELPKLMIESGEALMQSFKEANIGKKTRNI
jgi:LPXTG-motif cell wall-anchored protein